MAKMPLLRHGPGVVTQPRPAAGCRPLSGRPGGVGRSIWRPEEASPVAAVPERVVHRGGWMEWLTSFCAIAARGVDKGVRAARMCIAPAGACRWRSGGSWGNRHIGGIP